jgi:DNA-binding transcriptional LysR family regulator
MKTDLNLLRVLLAVHETGNVTAAARRLGMSQPAASAALARLRHSLDDALFVRSGQSMAATPRAQSIIERTREVIDIIDRDILSNPSFDPATNTEPFTFCLSEIGEIAFLPTLLAHFRTVAPLSRICSLSLSHKDVVEHLHEGKVDLVMGYFPDLDAPSIYQQRLFSHDLVCIIRNGHAIKDERLSLKQFCALDHLQVRDGGRNQEMYESFLAGAGVKRNIVLQMGHYMSTAAIIERSNLVAVLPRTVASLYAGHAQVRSVELPLEFPTYDIKQHWHARFHKDPRNQWIRQTIRMLFQDDQPGVSAALPHHRPGREVVFND